METAYAPILLEQMVVRQGKFSIQCRMSAQFAGRQNSDLFVLAHKCLYTLHNKPTHYLCNPNKSPDARSVVRLL